MEDWAEIRRLHKSEKVSQAEIARQLSLSRNTVAKALRSQAPPRYERAPVTTSACAAMESAMRALLMQHPRMPASVLAERVGWAAGHSWFSENVARIRPEYAPADPCDRLVHCPASRCSAIYDSPASWSRITLGCCGRPEMHPGPYAIGSIMAGGAEEGVGRRPRPCGSLGSRNGRRCSRGRSRSVRW